MTKIDTVGKIIDIFEEFLNEKGIEIKNKERDWAKEDDPTELYSNIFGEDYYNLENQIIEALGK